MSKEDFKLNAELRSTSGKGASRRLRREAGLVPGIIYGDDKAPEMITVKHNELIKHLENEAFYSHIISLNVGGESKEVILKDLQRHPSKPVVMHADFLRVSKTKKLHTKVPLHFINEEKCKGVKLEGGIVSHSLTELDITCLAADLPEYIEVDLINLSVGDVFHISDINLPEGVSSVALSHGADHDQPVATVIKPRGMASDSDDSDAAAEGGE